MLKVMFVCTGNICRSAMAHQYMQKRLYDLKRENDIAVSSCGISAITGQRATTNAIETMKKYDTDMLFHKATNIFDIDIENYDLIFGMTIQHKNYILAYFPKLKGKVFTLKEYVEENVKNVDIDDPWGYDLKIYDSCSKEIVDCVDKLLKKI